jgi:hypothetical protein
MTAVQDLIEMFAKGGIEITTFDGADGEASERPPLLRTVIQPNANVITWTSRGKEYPQAWVRHYEKLHSRIESIRRIRAYLQYSGFLSYFILVPAVIRSALTEQLVPFILSLILALVTPFLLRFFFAYALRIYIRRQMQRFVSVQF